MGDLTESSTPPPPPSAVAAAGSARPVPFREDCWSEEATGTLVDAWGRRYLEMNRGNLRQKDWQEVADTVNELHGQTKKTRRTDVQCKNRIDTLKKKYKTEKAKIAETNGVYVSPWPFFPKLDFLIGSKGLGKTPAPAQAQVQPMMSLASPPMAVPLSYRNSGYDVPTPFVLPQKRPNPVVEDTNYFKRNYSAMAAAAAAAPDDDDEDSEAEEVVKVKVKENKGVGVEEGMKSLAKSIEKFGEVYEKVESMKQRQMVELEKQRMQFARDLEVQRMQLFMDMQLQFERIKRVKRAGSSDGIDLLNFML